jgi:hypothetical protein
MIRTDRRELLASLRSAPIRDICGHKYIDALAVRYYGRIYVRYLRFFLPANDANRREFTAISSTLLGYAEYLFTQQMPHLGNYVATSLPFAVIRVIRGSQKRKRRAKGELRGQDSVIGRSSNNTPTTRRRLTRTSSVASNQF